MKRTRTTPKNPIEVTAYHGSGTAIDEFSYEFTSIGNDELGSGFYFTSSIDEAFGYTERQLGGAIKPGGQDTPTIHIARLTLQNPMPHDLMRDLSAKEARGLIERSPKLDDALTDWGDAASEGHEQVLSRAATSYATQGTGEPVLFIRELHKIANDFYSGETRAFNQAVQDVLGFDSIISRFERTGDTHYVAFFVEQIEVLERVPRAEFERRLDLEQEGRELSPA